MSRLLHDFPDREAVRMLRNARKVMPPAGVLPVREGVLPEGAVPLRRALLDVEMMVMNGGRERTEAEWKALLSSAGFSSSRVVPGPGSQGLIEAKPA